MQTECGYCGKPVKPEEVVATAHCLRAKRKSTVPDVALRTTRWLTKANVKPAQGGIYVRWYRPKLHRNLYQTKKDTQWALSMARGF